MSSTPFLVLNRSNRRVLHECASLAEARGYSEACQRPTAIAMLAEVRSKSEWQFKIEIVNGQTGRVLARSEEMDLHDALEEFVDVVVMLVPARLSTEVVQP